MPNSVCLVIKKLREFRLHYWFNFWFVQRGEKMLKRQRFASKIDLIAAWDKAFADLPHEKWDQICNELFLLMQMCVDCVIEYFENVQKIGPNCKIYQMTYVW